MADILDGLDGFAAQFRAQIANAGVPSSEHAIHFGLALGFQAAYDFDPGAIVFEKPCGRGRIDLWVSPLDLLIEVKFRRPIPSGSSQAATALFGHLLADFNKVSIAPARQRLIVYVSDTLGANYLSNSGRGALPLVVGQSTMIRSEQIASLPLTAAKHAVGDGPWRDVSTELIWDVKVDGWRLLAWSVSPIGQ